MRDVMIALRTMCLEEDSIFGLVADRIWVNKIPRADVEAADTFHPPKMLVLRMAGGSGKTDLLAIDKPLISTLCYGEDDYQANRVRRAVWEFFVSTARVISEGTLIHDINPTGGAIPNTEPDLVWPVIAQTYTVLADVREVA